MSRTLLSGALVALASLTLAAAPAVPEWKVEVPHSGIDFSVRHFFTPVQGPFESYDAQLHCDQGNPENRSVRVEIEAASVETGNDRREFGLGTGSWAESAMVGGDVEVSIAVEANR